MLYEILKNSLGLGLLFVVILNNFSLRKKCEILENSLQEKQIFFENVTRLNANYNFEITEALRSGRELVSKAKKLEHSSKENNTWYNTKLPYDVVQLLTARVSD